MADRSQPERRVDLPEDGTPYAGAYVDVAARVAWLLRVHRLLSPHPDTSSLAGFARRLSAAGQPADPSRISRWETGAVAPAADVITAYEVALELEPGQLLAVCEGLGHSMLSRHRVRPTVPALDEHSQQRLDGAYERVVDLHGRGGDWLTLAGLLTGARPALVPRRIVEDLTNQLVQEMTRSVGIAYYTRFEALCRLAASALTAPVVARGVTAAIRADGAQSILDAMTLYGEIPHPRMVDTLTGIAGRDGGRFRLGAVHALLNMVLLGTLPVSTVPTVETLSVQLLDPQGDVPGQRLGHLLAARLPAESLHRVSRRSGIAVATPVSPSRRSHALPTSLPHYLAAASRFSGIVQDPMLARLLRELLAGEFVERQHQAALMLLASPYRAVLAETAVRLVPELGEAATSAVHLLTYLASAKDAPALRGLLTTADPSLRDGILRALTHADSDPLDTRAANPAAGSPGGRARQTASAPQPSPITMEDLSEAGINEVEILYAAGMSGHPVLERLAESPQEPHERRSAARWWRTHGPAVRS